MQQNLLSFYYSFVLNFHAVLSYVSESRVDVDFSPSEGVDPHVLESCFC